MTIIIITIIIMAYQLSRKLWKRDYDMNRTSY